VATILSSKSFILAQGDNMPTNEIEEWFYTINRTDDCKLTVKIATTKPKKRTVLEVLDAYIDEYKISYYSKLDGIYFFDFGKRKYRWGDDEIHFTTGEQLFLYRWLILNDEIHTQQWFYLRNIRKRLGKTFLAGIAEGKDNDT